MVKLQSNNSASHLVFFLFEISVPNKKGPHFLPGYANILTQIIRHGANNLYKYVDPNCTGDGGGVYSVHPLYFIKY